MNEILIANLTLDTYRKNNVPPLIVPQGDYGARVIRVNVTDQGKPVFVESTAAVSIVATRSGDGESLAFSGKVNDDGSVTVPVTQWMLDIPDEDVICHVVVTGNMYQYSTTRFLIEPQEKANPTEITPDDPRADVVTQVLVNENARQEAEATRTANENARKTAENSRQSAETQRLTDEATRITNEAQRVSAESSRDATFKSWANDIALLPDMSARISRNSKRLDGLEQRIKPSPFVFDETVAYQKDVPSDAVGAAEIHKIGGMTYKDGDTLKSAKVTEVKSVGNNLWSAGNQSFIGSKQVTLEQPIQAGTYTMALDCVSNDTDDIYSLVTFIGGGDNGTNVHISVSRVTKTITTITLSNTVSQIRLNAGHSYSTSAGDAATYSNIMINKGSTALPNTPYVEHTLPIPEAVRPANGINENVYDYIEWADDRSVKKVVRCGVADMGTLNVAYNSSGNRFEVTMPENYNKPTTEKERYHLLCDLYTPNQSPVYGDYIDKTISGYNNSRDVYINDSSYTDAATFKAAMSGVMLVYELAEPIVTDISDLITADNLIGVEGGGTLTFENEYGYAVPSTVEYITAESDE